MNPEQNNNDTPTVNPDNSKPKVAPPLTSSTPEETPAVQQPVTPAQTPQTSQPKKRRFSPKKLLIALVILLLLVGGSAAAYFGYVVPNQPENRVLQSFLNASEQRQITVSGALDVTESGEQSMNVAIDYVVKANGDTKQLALSGDVGVGGVQFPFDVRYVDEDLYLKVSGLGGLDTVLGGEFGSAFSAANDTWYVVDRSFAEQTPEASCISDLSFTLNDEDTDKLKAAYEKHPLFTVLSTEDADVDGVATTKMQLDPTTNEEAAAFANELKTLSIVQKIQECVGEDAIDDVTATAEEEDAGELYLYITDDEQIRKIEATSDDEGSKGSFTATFDYASVSVDKPEDAQPIQELLGALLGGYVQSTGQLPANTVPVESLLQ